MVLKQFSIQLAWKTKQKTKKQIIAIENPIDRKTIANNQFLNGELNLCKFHSWLKHWTLNKNNWFWVFENYISGW